VFRVTIPGLPKSCPSCGLAVGEWVLSYARFQITIACPNCFSLLGRVVAVPPPDDDDAPDNALDQEIDDLRGQCQGMIP
jgi:hypothetical protein